jgi:hypothetical protein
MYLIAAFFITSANWDAIEIGVVALAKMLDLVTARLIFEQAKPTR